MINVNHLDLLTSLFSSIFYYGLKEGYSSTSIQERILNSKYIDELEKGNDFFLLEKSETFVIESIYERKIEEEALFANTSLSLWLAEIYIALFFKFNKSFSYLFLYLRLKEAINLYPIYHELDISELIEYFKNQSEKIDSFLISKKKSSFFK